MQRYTLKAGNLAHLTLAPFDLAPPALGEVRVAVRAIGLNFADLFAILGLYGATPKGVFTPGLEYAGTIEQVGEGITHLRPGDRGGHPALLRHQRGHQLAGSAGMNAPRRCSLPSHRIGDPA